MAAATTTPDDDQHPPTMHAWQTGPSGITTTLEAALILNRSAPAPTAAALAPDEILIEVLAASLNPADYKMAELGLATKLLLRGAPCQPGMDYSGRVVAAHPSVAASHPDLAQPGTLVFGAIPNAPAPPKHGTLSTLTVATPARAAPVPASASASVSAAAAACVGIAGLSALGALEQAGVGAGSRVLVAGGSGGVGTFAIQMAKAALGAAHVTATCSAGNAALCRELGADAVVDYRAVGGDVVDALVADEMVFDAVIDNVGDPAARLYERAARFLAPAGVYVQVGAESSVAGLRSLAARSLRPRWLGGGERAFRFFQGQVNAEGLRKVGAWMAEGKVTPVIDSEFGFDEVPQAFAKLRTGRARGKIVVHVGK